MLNRENMNTVIEKKKKATGLYTDDFHNAFRNLFRPVTRSLMWIGISPNTVTFFSIVLGFITGILLALNYLWSALMVGYVMAFSDIIDGQLAKEYSSTSKFGGILDSTIDRYNEFFIFAGLGIRYYFHGRLLWTLACAVVFLNSVMISYVRARAEAAGFDCNIGKLQRPERLTIVAIGVAFGGLLLEPAIAVLVVFTQLTVLHRIYHVYKQSK